MSEQQCTDPGNCVMGCCEKLAAANEAKEKAERVSDYFRAARDYEKEARLKSASFYESAKEQMLQKLAQAAAALTAEREKNTKLEAEVGKWKCAAHAAKHDDDDSEHSGVCDSYGICAACSHDCMKECIDARQKNAALAKELKAEREAREGFAEAMSGMTDDFREKCDELAKELEAEREKNEKLEAESEKRRVLLIDTINQQTSERQLHAAQMERMRAELIKMESLADKHQYDGGAIARGVVQQLLGMTVRALSLIPADAERVLDGVRKEAEQKTAELAAIIETMREALQYACPRICANQCSTMLSIGPERPHCIGCEKIQAALALKSPAAQVLAERDKEVVRAIALRLDADPHQWSKRPCATCSDISKLVGIDFGCVAYEKSPLTYSEYGKQAKAAALSSKSAIGPEEGGKR